MAITSSTRTDPDRARRITRAPPPKAPESVKGAKASPVKRDDSASDALASRPTETTRALAREQRSLDEQRLRGRIDGGQPRPLGAADTAAFRPANDGFIVTRRGGAAQDDLALPDKWGDRPASLEEVRDPDYVDDDGTEAQQEAARARVDNRTGAELTALEGLEEDQRERYEDIAVLTEDDPRARESLQTMLLDGDFDGEDGARLLDEVHGLTEDALAEGIDREELVSDLVQELEDPAAIAQRGKGTCVATSSEIYLAQHDPAEYARLVRGLASPEGRVELKNGDTIRREGGTIEDDGSNRAITQRLLAPALMEYGNGSENYSNDEDRNSRWIFDRGSGLNGGEADRLLEAVTGQTFDRETASANAEDRAELAQQIIDAANGGDTISTSLQWGDDSGHRVLVTGGDDDWVYFTNPWGVEHRMSREDFDQRVKDGLFPE